MGWFNMKNMCYRGFGFSPPTAKTWNDAEKDCNANGGNLASVTTQYVLCEYHHFFFFSKAELPTLPDSAESSLKINQSFHVLMNKLENLPEHANPFPYYVECNFIMLSGIISLVVVQKLPDGKMQRMAALLHAFFCHVLTLHSKYPLLCWARSAKV